MRKWNAVLGAAMILLFLIHAIFGGFQLAGMLPGGSKVLSVLSRLLVVLLIMHTVIGIRLTCDTIAACRRSGVSYFKENKIFWARRVSGFAVIVFLLSHLPLFMGRGAGVYRLKLFDSAQLAMQLLLVASVALHVLTNVRPLLIAFGARRLKEYAADILIVLSVLLLLAAVAFLIYYLRWNVI